jgi:DNA replication protein DnaC
MDSVFKTVGDCFNPFVEQLAKRHAERAREEAEREARNKAEFDALPEEEKQRILALREQERQELERERQENERKDAEREREELLAKWRRRGVTPRFYNATWENWKTENPKQASVLEKVKQAWGKNLFMVGGNGTGKTHLAMCLAKEGATYCLVPELFRSVREDMSIEQETIDDYGECKLLILDEAGRQKGTDFERNLLFEIIDKRWNNMLPTTIIGNITKKEFANLYGTAVVDRLRPETVELDWKSRREGGRHEQIGSGV